MTELNNRDNARLLASYLMSLSLFTLAGAIVYFTYEVAIVSKQIPDILNSINSTSDKIEPVIDEVAEIVVLIPPILKEIEETRKLIPPILKEVEQTRKMIPPILKEVEQTRDQIPLILNESAAIRGELPAILASADKASTAVAAVSEQVEASRPIIADVLQEVKTTREAISPMMDRADVLIEKARIAGKEASEGAVTGLFTGIIKAPFALVASAGRSLTGLTEEDVKDFDEKDHSHIRQSFLYLLNNGSKGEQREWKNADSGNHGTVQLTRIYSEGEYAEIDCRSLKFELYTEDENAKQGQRSFCKDDDGKWDVDE